MIISNNPDIEELYNILLGMTKLLLESSGNAGRVGANVRRIIGDLMGNLASLIRDLKLGIVLNNMFKEATKTGISLFWLDRIINYLFAQNPKRELTTTTVHVCIFFALAQQARIISNTVYTSREDVDALMLKLQRTFSDAKEMAADHMDSMAYYSLVELAAAVTHHLVKTARPLPRLVNYEMPAPLSALVLSQRIYSDASRFEELLSENHVVHPAFVRPKVRALSV